MGVVNPPQVMPVVMRAICRYFAYRGPGHEVMRGELERILEPSGATQPGEARPRPVGATLTEAVSLGVVREVGAGDEALLSYSADWPDASFDSIEYERELAAILRRVILDDRNTAALFSRSERASDEDEDSEATQRALDTTEGREFARMAAWLLLQDPNGPGLAYGVKDRQPTEDVEERQKAQCTVTLVINDVRWESFRRWARYLGLARTGLHRRLVPDPTTAISHELPHSFADLDELPVDSFMQRLAARIPVLDDGRCHAEVLQQAMKSDPRSDSAGDRPVSSAVAFSLARLERRGILRLDDRADAPSHRDVAGRVITHVVRGAE